MYMCPRVCNGKSVDALGFLASFNQQTIVFAGVVNVGKAMPLYSENSHCLSIVHVYSLDSRAILPVLYTTSAARRLRPFIQC